MSIDVMSIEIFIVITSVAILSHGFIVGSFAREEDTKFDSFAKIFFFPWTVGAIIGKFMFKKRW